LKIKPTDYLRFLAEGTSSRNDIRYVSPLTRAEFRDDPRQSAGTTYTHQGLNTDQWKVGTEYDITESLKLTATHYQEDKKSEFTGFISDYDYRSNDISLSFNHENISAIVGYQNFDGDRKTSSNTTTKNNSAIFVSGEYRPTWISEALTLSAGARNEKVNYRYNPTTGATLKDSEHLDAWDVGANYRFTPELTILQITTNHFRHQILIDFSCRIFRYFQPLLPLSMDLLILQKSKHSTWV